MQKAGPRVLLRKMRDVMDERISAQACLDKIVFLIAANMVAEVCSIYFIKAGGWLELYATEGLNKDAVHRTRLKMGEGIVCLLYTSPSPRDRTRSRMPSSA